MPRITYDPELRQTEHGSRLYAYWKRIRGKGISQAFEKFDDFYHWSMKNDYTVGAKLIKYDPDEPYGPDNCFWIPRSEWAANQTPTPRNRAWENSWDETVNRIREHYGMEPIYSSEV